MIQTIPRSEENQSLPRLHPQPRSFAFQLPTSSRFSDRLDHLENQRSAVWKIGRDHFGLCWVHCCLNTISQANQVSRNSIDLVVSILLQYPATTGYTSIWWRNSPPYACQEYKMLSHRGNCTAFNVKGPVESSPVPHFTWNSRPDVMPFIALNCGECWQCCDWCWKFVTWCLKEGKVQDWSVPKGWVLVVSNTVDCSSYCAPPGPSDLLGHSVQPR